MRRRFLAGLCIGALGVCPVWSGCATQQQDNAAVQSGDASGASSPTSGSGGSSESGASGKAAGGTTGGGASGGVAASSGSGGAMASAGTAPTAGEAGAAGAGGEPSSGGAAGAGGAGGAAAGCTPADCDDGNPCTTDSCGGKTCSHAPNTTACADDKDPCTADVCAAGTCTHPDNKTCECKTDATCDDKNVCTDDTCDVNHKCSNAANTGPCPDDGMTCTTDLCAAKKCVHTPDGTCPVGNPFTVDNFNSGADWTAMKTTPDMRAIVHTGADLFNLESNADLYVAVGGGVPTASVEFALASMVGMGKLRILIRSAQANTGTMVTIGVWNGTAWTDKPLGAATVIPMGAAYATVDFPTADFAQPLTSLTKMRLTFTPTGGQKTWYIDEISAVR